MKKRPKLPPEYEALYVEQYKANRGGKTRASRLSQWLEGWMHRRVAEDKDDDFSTLEIGAGNLNHMKYENVWSYDIVEPFVELYQDSDDKENVAWAFRDISEIRADFFYDRIISIATFEHVADLDAMVDWTRKHLLYKGRLRVAIPNEGCWLWTLGWRLTTGLEFWLKHRLDYGVLMRHEHLNTADEIDATLREHYGIVKVRYFGLGKHFSLYRFYECREPFEAHDRRLYE